MTTAETEPTEAVAEEELIEGTPEQRIDARERAQKCNEEVRQVLEKYSCSIVPQFNQPEPVGVYNNKLILSATTYAVVPYPE